MNATRNLSINGFALVSGQPHVFTIADKQYTGVVTRTGSNIVRLRLADGSERDFGQCSITEIRDVTDAEWILFDQGTDAHVLPTWTETFEGATFQTDAIGFPVNVEGGIRCGSCGKRHSAAKAVKFCYLRAADMNAQIDDEIRAEKAVERFFEERGYEAARMEEDMERARGIY